MGKELLILTIIILMPLISASINIEPSLINISVNKGTEASFNFNISNYYGFNIYDLTFSNLSGFTFPKIDINSNSAKIITFSVKTNYSYNGIISPIVSFKYLANIPEEITTYNLNITSNLSDSYLTIRKGDTITWYNNDDVTHNLQSTEFEASIPPKSSYSKIFTNTGTIEYRSIVAGITMFSGKIEVINRTGEYLVSNPLYNFIYSINLQSIPEPTTLEASISQNNYTIEVQNYKEGLLTIKNIGNNSAESIYLSSSPTWVNFDENNFNLNSQEIKYIKFKIYPELLYSNQTNLSYDINLIIKGLNTETYNSNLKVFVPYSNIFGDITSEEGFLIWFTEVYCPMNPNNFLCNTSARNLNETGKIIYREYEFSVNMTGSDWYNLVKIIGQINDRQQRSENTQSDFEYKIMNTLTSLDLSMNQTSERVDNFISDQNALKIGLWIVGFFLFLAVSIIIIVLSVRRLIKQKELVDIYPSRKFT